MGTHPTDNAYYYNTSAVQIIYKAFFFSTDQLTCMKYTGVVYDNFKVTIEFIRFVPETKSKNPKRSSRDDASADSGGLRKTRVGTKNKKIPLRIELTRIS